MATDTSINYYNITPDEACGYMRPHLEALKNAGVEVQSLLDIGAAHGHFSDFFRSIFPKTKVLCVECNERDHHYLDGRYDTRFVCLGKEACTKTFYMDKLDPIGGGSSFYKENTLHFDDPITENKPIVTLDSLNLGAFDFIKLDTQGSECDIIDGGEATIRQARFLLIECSFVDYNQDGCLIDDVLDRTRKLGFRVLDTFGPQFGGHWWSGRKIQTDVLFVRENDPLLSFVVQ